MITRFKIITIYSHHFNCNHRISYRLYQTQLNIYQIKGQVSIRIIHNNNLVLIQILFKDKMKGNHLNLENIGHQIELIALQIQMRSQPLANYYKEITNQYTSLKETFQTNQNISQ